MQQITKNVFGGKDYKGCNPGYVMTSEGAVVIDTPQLATKAVAMREEILKKGPIRFLINTESHIDHIFGNHFFAGLCPVVGHKDILDHFWTVISSGDPYSYSVELIKNLDPGGMALMPPKEGYIVNKPVIVFYDRLTLRVGEHVFELFNLPGHTKGQTAVYVPKEKTVFVGDTIFCECQTWLQSADPDRWLKSLDFLKTLDVDYIVPGHGPICNKDYIAKQSAFIREWVTAVAVGIAKGWSKEECAQRISFLERCPPDIGHEADGPMIQRMNAERIYDFLQGATERFE